jgi:excisionase family DNA binding protein
VTSAAVGGVAVVSGDAARPLLRLLGDWRKAAFVGGLDAESFAKVEEAVAALSAVSAVPSSGGNGEGQGKRSGVTIRLMTTSEAAAVLGVSGRRVRQFRDEGRLRSVGVGGRLVWSAADVERLRDERGGRNL